MFWLAVLDLVCLVIGSTIGVFMRLGHEEMGEYVFSHIDGWLLLFGGVILANYLAGSYRIQHTFSRFNLIVTWLFSLLFASLILSITSYAWFTFMVGRGVLFLSLASYSAMALVLKLLVYRHLFRSQALVCRTVILGTDEKARQVRKELENEYVLPAHKVVAYLRMKDGEDRGGRASVMDGVAIVDADLESLADIVRNLGVGLIVIGPEILSSREVLYPQLRKLRFDGVEVLSPLNVSEIYGGRTPLDRVNEEYLMHATMESRLPAVRRGKRVLDVVTAGVACIVFFPILLILAVVVKLASPRAPVFYTQERLGHFGKVFRIIKLRTMEVGAEDESGPVWADRDDPRVTPVGRFLRKFRLDEIPQFLNVLKGEMSIVGPRPERPELAAELEADIPFYAERVNLVPGMTGWAQIRHPYGNSTEDSARKLEYDLYYMKHLSLSLDLQIVLSTLRIVILGKERSI